MMYYMYVGVYIIYLQIMCNDLVYIAVKAND